VKKDLILQIRNTGSLVFIYIIIPKGNWNADQLTDYINTEIKNSAIVNTVVFDYGVLGFRFLTPIDIGPYTSLEALSVMGFPQPLISQTFDWDLYSNITMSQIPIKLSGPACINLNTQLPLFNLPSSGRLACVAVNKDYGDLISFIDESATQPPLLTSQYLDKITIQLTDENNEELECYDDIPWTLVIAIDPVEEAGFQKMTMGRADVEQAFQLE
jgi:hypothetical protein